MTPLEEETERKREKERETERETKREREKETETKREKDHLYPNSHDEQSSTCPFITVIPLLT